MRKRKKSAQKSGIINGFLNFLSDKILILTQNGFFGKLLSSNKLESEAAKGVVAGNLDALASGEIGSFRRTNLRLTDESVFMNLLRGMVKYLLNCTLNWYGVYFIVFAIYSILIHLVKSFIVYETLLLQTIWLSDNFIVPTLIIIAAVPLARCSSSLKSAVFNSGFVRPVLENFGGVSDNKFEDSAPINKATGYFVAVTLGILTGGISYFISPLNILFVIFVLFAVSVIMSLPELGLIFTIALFPFLGFFKHPTVVLVALVAVALIAYFSKVLIGKRVFRLRLIDILVCVFALLYLMGGFITSGGIDSFKSALVYCVLITVYFLVVNLFNTREWLQRSIASIAVPSIFVALYGIVGYASDTLQVKWLDMSMFSDITNRAVSFFENPNMLATYLIMTLPFVMMCVYSDKLSAKFRVFSLIGAGVSAGCIVLTWSRGAWLGVLVGMIVFTLIINNRAIKYWLVAGLTSPFWVSIIPDNVTNRFMSIGNLADSSTYYRLYTWKGSIKMFLDHWIGGIGVGEAAFTHVYPLYSYIGIESTVHSHNVFLQIAIELGVVALALFLIIMFLIAQNGFYTLKNTSDKTITLFMAASLSGIAAALVHGMVDHIWYNYRIFFAFWLVVALVVSCAEVARREKLSEGTNLYGMKERALSLDIIFG